MFLKLMELLIFVAGVWFIVTQMIFPAIRNTQSFPIFRKEKKLKEELVEVNQQVREKKLQESVDLAKKELEPGK